MISHLLDGWPHLRRGCAGISGSLSASSIIPPQSRTLPSRLPPLGLAIYSPPVSAASSPPRVEPVSLSACGRGSGPQLGRQAANDIIPRRVHVVRDGEDRK